MNISSALKIYVSHRPLFLSLIRAKELELFHRCVPYDKPVLDVGCGDGFFAHALKERIDIGLDVPDSRISEAKRGNIYQKVITYGGTTMPFAASSFRTVISNCVLEHIPDVRHVVREMHRIMTTDGRCIVSVMAKSWEDYLFGGYLFGNPYRLYMQKKQVHVHLYTPTQWKTIFHEAGFRVERCIGYLSPRACQFIDIAHYLSIPNLISYIIFHQWVLFPWATHPFPLSWLTNLIAPDVPVDDAGAVFFVLRKAKKSKIQKAL